MDHFRIIRRAFEITWRYRALWIFGIILALTTFSPMLGGNSNESDAHSGDFPWHRFRPIEIRPELQELWESSWLPWLETWGTTVLAVTIGVLSTILIVFVLFRIARYVSETALITMVNEHEETGEKRGAREGWRLGWSRAAFRLFLINVLIILPTMLAILLAFVITGAPALLWMTGNVTAGVIGTVAAIGLWWLVVLLAIAVIAVISLLIKFFRRVCVLEGKGVLESIREGYALVRRHLRDATLMWLLMTGLGIGWAIVTILLGTTLTILGAIVGSVVAYLIFQMASWVLAGPTVWILAVTTGLPVFMLVVAVPTVFVNGLFKTFESSVWTLTYRELRAAERIGGIQHGSEPQEIERE